MIFISLFLIKFIIQNRKLKKSDDYTSDKYQYGYKHSDRCQLVRGIYKGDVIPLVRYFVCSASNFFRNSTSAWAPSMGMALYLSLIHIFKELNLKAFRAGREAAKAAK